MIDLETQLREYIDGIADPIPSPAARAVVVEPVRWRRRGTALVAAVVVVVLVVAIVAVAVLTRSEDAPTRIEPARKPPIAVPLEVQGTADCTEVRKPGDTLDLAAVVNGGVPICITTLAGRQTVYLDGRERESVELPTANSTSFGFGDLWRNGLSVAFGYPAHSAEGVRMSFCDGTTIDVKPLTDAEPYWLGAEYDASLAGDGPSVMPLQDGHAAKPIIGSCPPPSTVAKGSRAIDHGTAFAPTGPADCSGVQQPGDLVLFAATVDDGHVLCVTGQDNRATFFADGREVGHADNFTQPPLGTTPNAYQLPLDRRRTLVFAVLLDRSDRLRYTFCDGRSVTLKALNDTAPRFAAGVIDYSRGEASTLMLDGEQPAGFRKFTCPPTIEAKAKSKPK